MQAWHTNHVNKYQFNTTAHEKDETTRRGCSESFMCVKTKGTPSPRIFYHFYLTGSSSM